jgi:nitrogen fixation/metabolism regulation signal transduction histidine kinase
MYVCVCLRMLCVSDHHIQNKFVIAFAYVFACPHIFVCVLACIHAFVCVYACVQVAFTEEIDTPT